MPWTAASGKRYELVLLDTNALSEVVKQPQREGKAFLEMLRSGHCAPCFTVYNIGELKQAPEVFERVLDLVEVVPAFLTKPYDALLAEEVENHKTGNAIEPKLHAFHGRARDTSVTLRGLVSRILADAEVATAATMSNRDEAARVLLRIWAEETSVFESTKPQANGPDADRYVEQTGIESLVRLNKAWVRQLVNRGDFPDISEFPSLQSMLYSKYWRIWDRNWTLQPCDVRDVEIAAVAPYMDIFISERRQIEVFRKIRSKVRGLDRLRTMTLADLRQGPPTSMSARS